MLLLERNVDLGDHLPKSLDEVDFTRCDLIVNRNGMKLPSAIRVPVEVWPVDDP